MTEIGRIDVIALRNGPSPTLDPKVAIEGLHIDDRERTVTAALVSPAAKRHRCRGKMWGVEMGETDGHGSLANERWFFFYLALAILVTVVAGFGSQVVAGRTWFTDFPWQVHAHVALFSSWIILYVAQNWLVANEYAPQVHRRLGWLGVIIATLIVPFGIASTTGAIARGAINGVFPLGFFLALDVIHLLGFGALTFAGICMRSRSAWHKRLMFCGTVLLTAPAVSRLAGFLPASSPAPLVVIAALFVFLLAGMGYDRIVLGRVHPAYWWGVGATATVEFFVLPVGRSAPVMAFATWLAR